jgi:MFS family permease
MQPTPEGPVFAVGETIMSEPADRRPPFLLPLILLSMCGCISLWFAGNAVLADLQTELGLPPESLGFLSSAVQLGFIGGTLLFAILGVADRFPARRLYCVCAVAGALLNLLIYPLAAYLPALLLLRFLTGFMLAGIYPVGMKIAAGWYREGLGRVLGYLLGAFVLGTALPHLLKGLGHNLPWHGVLAGISFLAVTGGVVMLLLVTDGPYLRQGGKLAAGILGRIYQVRALRSAAFSYFGHMWELYAFWVFVPVFLAAWLNRQQDAMLNVPLWSFAIIGGGSIGCIVGGLISRRRGSAPVAFVQLAASGLCCLFSPLFFTAGAPLFPAFLLFWGIMVVGDSPQFSALVAAAAPPELVGTALTIVNCLGFLISIVSIELCNYLFLSIDPIYVFLFLTPGPLLGLTALWPLLRRERVAPAVES